MALPLYITAEYYKTVYGGTVKDNLNNRIFDACRHIDALTFNRLLGGGFERLSENQLEMIKTVCCKLIDFEYENEDLIKSSVTSYSINGVSAAFDTSKAWNIKVLNGVAMPNDLYNMLETTGLCYRGI